jgi:hypothetical protein
MVKGWAALLYEDNVIGRSFPLSEKLLSRNPLTQCANDGQTPFPERDNTRPMWPGIQATCNRLIKHECA